MKKLSYEDYLSTMRGCFLGKTIGGTLGMPYEGVLEVNHVTYYDPVPTTMVPNDDLDLQVVNLELVRRHGLPVCGRYLSEFWTDYMCGFPDEYGVANHNVIRGLYPPVSGYYGNFFHGGMGCAIRSELWACLAPGDPDLAVRLALEDASSDHDSDGVDASMFLTAIESAAFVEKDRDVLLEIGFSKITRNPRMTAAFRDVIRWWNEYGDALTIRPMILQKYPSQNWTDVTINLSFILLSWLASGGDFGKGICTAASLGYDADCTCATLGSIMGMLHPEKIEEKWYKPIGNQLVLSPCIVGAHEPATIEEWMNLIAETAVEVERFYGSAATLVPEEGMELPQYIGTPFWTKRIPLVSYRAEDAARSSLVAVKPLAVRVVYAEEVALMNPEGTHMTVRIANPMKQTAIGSVSLRVPNGWTVKPETIDISLMPGEEIAEEICITRPENTRFAWKNPMDISMVINGISCEASAGLILPIPYRLASEDKPRFSATNMFPVPAGKQTMILEVKAGCRLIDMRLLAQGTRSLTLKVNGVAISSHDNSFYVPAFHRNPDAVIGCLNEGWNRIEIEMTDESEPAGEIFFGIADQFGWEWANKTEYRVPEV